VKGATIVYEFFRRPGRFLKGNLHAHTTESDGHKSPADLARMYRDAGYDFLALTDHHRWTDPSGIGVEGLTLIRGQECHPSVNRLGEAHHILALGTERWIESTRGDSPQATIDEISAAGGLAFLAHPWWHGTTAAEMLELTGWLGIEVYNATCEITISRGDSAPIWDEILASGRQCLALAVDDCHSTVLDGLQGWIHAKTESASPEGILAAIEAGDFYSSTGPEILDLGFEDGKLRVRSTPVRIASLISYGARGGRKAMPPGETFEEALLPIPEGATYVRLVLTDPCGRKAWTNPVWVG
jgi:hypothetical protein